MRMAFCARHTAMLGLAVVLCHALPVFGQTDAPLCGDEGIWIQILGAGAGELDDGEAGPSYLLWIDGKARLLVDTGPGASLRYEQAGATFSDLDAIVFTHLHANHTAGFSAFVAGSLGSERDRPLPVFGPSSSEDFPDTETFIGRLIGPTGAWPHLADMLTYRSSAGFKINPRNVPATGRRRWARFGNEHFRLSAIPVQHAQVPAVAWRVEIDARRIVFTGDFNNSKNVITEFAKDADALVVSHAIPESARGDAREAHVVPSQIGRVASNAGVRMIILGHRSNRTRGLESQTRAAIETHYEDPLLFANDLECWGL